MNYFIVNGNADVHFPYTDFNNASDFFDGAVRTKLGVTYGDGEKYNDVVEIGDLYKTLLGKDIETIDFYDENNNHVVQFTEFNYVIRSRVSYYSKENGGDGIDVVVVFGKQ